MHLEYNAACHAYKHVHACLLSLARNINLRIFVNTNIGVPVPSNFINYMDILSHNQYVAFKTSLSKNNHYITIYSANGNYWHGRLKYYGYTGCKMLFLFTCPSFTRVVKRFAPGPGVE